MKFINQALLFFGIDLVHREEQGFAAANEQPGP